jgi:ribosomal protein S12 methylthiotransferase accessory factor
MGNEHAMTGALTPTFRHGTQRLVPPERTLARLEPHLAEFGITRCADITGLEVDLGLPVYIAIRPRGRVFQSSAGKGLGVAAAKVSALMEAVELDVAERPDPARLRHASLAELKTEGQRIDALPEWVAAASRFFGNEFRIPWTLAEDLLRGGEVWVPAGAVYFCEPTPCRTYTNGLASGNHLLEATLHALYEVIERDAVARLIEDDRLMIARDCRVIDPASVIEPSIAAVIQKIERSDNKLVILQILSGMAVPTYWALLLNRQPFAGISTLSSGYGTHLDSMVALSRAVTEAVQSRLTMIQGSRNDIVGKPVYVSHVAGDTDIHRSPAFRYFDALEATAQADLTTFDGDFDTALRTVLSLLLRAGHERVYRVDLHCPVKSFSVVKVLVPSLRWQTALM